MKKKINIIILLVLFMSSCGDSNNGSIDNYFFNNVVKPPITSLDGLWESSDCKVAISGNSGTVVEVNSSSYINLVNLGLVKIGDLKIKNIATYANLKWSCDMLIQVGDNIQWLSGILTLGSDGKTFTVQIGSGPNIFASESFNRINTTNDKPVLSTTSLKSIGSNTATFTTILLSDGGNAITSKGVCWGTSTNPTISNSKTSDGSGSGKFESNITGLTANSSYYVSAYATNAKGTSYSNQVQLVTLPIVNLGLVDDLTYSGVTVSGNIPTQGNNAINEYGIFWGTNTGKNV
jgi:hypothetical protein